MTKLKKTIIFSGILLSSLFSSAQIKKYVEELALYHLDSLTKIDKTFKDFRYFTNGYIEKRRTSPDDTTFVVKIEPDLFIKSPFKDLIILEDTTVTTIPLARRLRKNGGREPLTMLRFLKVDQDYYVFFKIEYEEGGQCALIVMDRNGSLKHRQIGNYIY